MTSSPMRSRIADAEGALDGLREALAAVGVTLPSLRLHHSTWSGDDDGPGHIELGACNVATARQLAAALRKAHRP